MIPGYSELPESVFEELTKNPQLLAWFADVQRQLISSTVELNGIGCTRIMWNTSGVTIDALDVVDSSALSHSYFNAAGSLASSGVVVEGNWIASSGGLPAGVARAMTRVS